MYADCDEKGVPRLQVLKRERGARPQRRMGQQFWEYIDGITHDLMVLSREGATWRQYAAWFGVFEEFCQLMGVCPQLADMHVLCGVLVRSLGVLFEGGGYAAKSLELYVTAVSSTLRDLGKGDVRSSGSVNKLMEGMRRTMGMAVGKKMPVEGQHIAAWLGMGHPQNDRKAWTGKHSGLQWEQFVAIAVTVWSCFPKF